MAKVTLDGDFNLFLGEFVDSFIGGIARGLGSTISASSGFPFAALLKGSGLFHPPSGFNFLDGRITSFKLTEISLGPTTVTDRIVMEDIVLDPHLLFSLVSRTATTISGKFETGYFGAIMGSQNYDVTGSDGADVIGPGGIADLDRSDIFRLGGGNDNADGGAGNDRIEGGTGDDVLFGNLGDDTLEGEAGDDTLGGGEGNDTLGGGSGNDALSGGEGDDRLSGGTGHDTLDGEAGNDRADGGSGNDALNGNLGNDVLLGRAGKDTANGGKGNDTLAGHGGNDTLKGGEGRDALLGGKGRDTLSGGAGNDRLDGGGARDLLTGGANADRFVFGAGYGRDTVADFASGTDALELATALWGGGLGRAKIVKQFASLTKDGAKFDFGDGDVLVLRGIDDLATLADDLVLI